MLRVKDIARRRIINDNRLSQISAHLAEIFHVVALMIVAAFTEESVVDNVVDVELVEKGIAVFRDRSREDNDFVEFADTFEESIYAWSFYDVDVVVLSFYFDGYGEVCLVENLRSKLATVLQNSLYTGWVRLTLKLLWTRVSSRSSTKHLRPSSSDRRGGSSHFGGGCGSGVDIIEVSWLCAVPS